MKDFNSETFDALAAWIKSNKGQKFKVREDDVFETYKDETGKKRKLRGAGAKDPDLLVEYLKDYIDKAHGNENLPQVEFSNCYTYFKIY